MTYITSIPTNGSVLTDNTFTGTCLRRSSIRFKATVSGFYVKWNRQVNNKQFNFKNSECLWETEIGSVYENLCSIIKTELHNTLPLLGATRSTNKRLRPRKPFWDDNLQRLWDIMKRNEEDFLQCKQDRRLRFQLRTEYVKSKNEFDKHLSRTERPFKLTLRRWVPIIQTISGERSKS